VILVIREINGERNMTRLLNTYHGYALYEARAAVIVGISSELKGMHPLVSENESKVPIGLIALSADSDEYKVLSKV